MFVKVLGGGVVKDHREWGASCIFLSVNDDVNIVVDCGIRINNSSNGFSVLPDLDFFNDKKIDLIAFTHPHADHIGAGPVIAARHPEAKIWMTADTADLSDLQLMDQIRIAERMSRKPLFSRDELGAFQQRTEIVSFERWESVGSGVEICFWPAGHLRGAASILVRHAGQIVMVSGDVSLNDLPTVEAAKPLPVEYRKNLILITEATGAADRYVDRANEERRFVEAVRQIIAAGGNVLIPAFALGKAQDTALHLASAGIPVMLGGMAAIVFKSRAYSHFARSNPNISRLQRDEDVSRFAHRVVVTTHGMLEFGRSRELAYAWMEDPRNAIFIPGYQAPGTFGKKLLESPPGKFIFFEEKNPSPQAVPSLYERERNPSLRFESEYSLYEMENNPAFRRIRARVERFHLSGHAQGRGLASRITTMNPKKVLVVHAERAGYYGLRSLLRNSRYLKPVVPMTNGRIHDL